MKEGYFSVRSVGLALAGCLSEEAARPVSGDGSRAASCAPQRLPTRAIWSLMRPAWRGAGGREASPRGMVSGRPAKHPSLRVTARKPGAGSACSRLMGRRQRRASAWAEKEGEGSETFCKRGRSAVEAPADRGGSAGSSPVPAGSEGKPLSSGDFLLWSGQGGLVSEATISALPYLNTVSEPRRGSRVGPTGQRRPALSACRGKGSVRQG